MQAMGNGISHLLGVPKIASETDKAQAAAVKMFGRLGSNQ